MSAKQLKKKVWSYKESQNHFVRQRGSQIGGLDPFECHEIVFKGRQNLPEVVNQNDQSSNYPLSIRIHTFTQKEKNYGRQIKKK
jgi:hypothetical protein